MEGCVSVKTEPGIAETSETVEVVQSRSIETVDNNNGNNSSNNTNNNNSNSENSGTEENVEEKPFEKEVFDVTSFLMCCCCDTNQKVGIEKAFNVVSDNGQVTAEELYNVRKIILIIFK